MPKPAELSTKKTAQSVNDKKLGTQSTLKNNNSHIAKTIGKANDVAFDKRFLMLMEADCKICGFIAVFTGTVVNI